MSSARLASSASGCAGMTVPSAIKRRTSDFIVLWCIVVSLSIFRAGDGERQLCKWSGGVAKPHPLKRPLDAPAGVGQALQEFVLLADGIDQQWSGFGPNDLVDHRKRLIQTICKQRAD